MVEDTPRPLRLEHLGEIPYEAGVERMRALAAARARGEGEDTLLLMRHPEVVTVGRRRGARDNILDDAVPVYEADRGGDVTWHGPGQLVGYPVLRLEANERDVHVLLRALEGGLIATLEALGLRAMRHPPHTGVWAETEAGQRKLCSIGLGVRDWVSLHGFALNVDCELSRFGVIRPCGLESAVMGSLASAGIARPWDGLEARLHHHLAVALGREPTGTAGS